MNKSNNPLLISPIIAGLVLTLSFAALAADDNPNDQNQKKTGPAPVTKTVHTPAAKPSMPPTHTVQHQKVDKNANTAARQNTGGQSASNPVITKHVTGNKPATTPATGPQVAQQHNTRNVHTTNVTNTQATAPSGGKQYTRANNYGGRWTAGNNHPQWNQGQVNDWNGHQYRWYNGGWLMVDGGFWPVPEGYQGGGQGGSSRMADAQQQLATDGYYNGPIDGIAGPGTRQAIANFQGDNNLPTTGHLNVPTRESLGIN